MSGNDRPRPPPHARNSSISKPNHAPVNPSGLRNARTASSTSSDGMNDAPSGSNANRNGDRQVETDEEGIGAVDYAESPSPRTSTETNGQQEASYEPDLRSRLLGGYKDWDQATGCDDENCTHGAISPRPCAHRSYGSFASTISPNGFGGPSGAATPPDKDGLLGAATHKILGDRIADELMGGTGQVSKSATTRYLARRHGIKNQRSMYLAYYLPFLTWMRQYKWAYLKGDLIAAITMASFYIPMSLSLASNLGHIPAINGMYSFVFNPLIYAVLGSCPQMVVGPEAAGSLLTGEIVRENINKGRAADDDGHLSAEIAGVLTCMAGAFILVAGIFRLGFLDNVLSRPFLRGFISAIGVVIFVDQLIPELGLEQAAKKAEGVVHGSTLQKFVFLCQNLGNSKRLTAAVSLGALAIIMICREIKSRLQKRYAWAAYIPDRFIIVVLSAIFSWKFEWDKQGLMVLGDVKTSAALFTVHWPFRLSHIKYASDAFGTAFIIALLGFFESSVAAKSLGTGGSDGIKSMPLSANRELIALGVANITGGLFMALPAFGGYGRSKVNASTGGRTPMSSIFLAIITVLCLFFLLPYFYYLPKGVLCAMISVVAYSLIEEAPHDISFFIRIRGWSELTLMFLIFITTICWDIKKGIAVGIGLSILRVIRHSTRPRIQILGRVPGTTDKFENAEADPGRLEFVEGCLIVKIPEPLHFANTGDLRTRLRRLEEHGTNAAHPALPRVRQDKHNKNIIFDVHGVTSLDGAGAQVLSEIIEQYRARGVRVFFCRVPSKRSKVWYLFEKSGIVDCVGGERHFLRSVEEALRMSELESMSEELGRVDEDGGTQI